VIVAWLAGAGAESGLEQVKALLRSGRHAPAR